MPQPLPEFEAPPVDEVILGVDFAPIDGWKVPYAGLFWNEIRQEYPRCDVLPPVMQQIETFPANAAVQPSFKVLTDPNLVRCWFLTEAQTEIVQIQPDRFLRNWRHVTGEEAYPRYSSLRPSFERDWTRFVAFLEQSKLGAPQVLQGEVTYINNIEKGAGWDTFADLPYVTPLWAGGTTSGFLTNPESTSLGLSYAMENDLGRLRINLNHAIRIRDGKEILQLQLTARGKLPGPSDVLDWLDRGRGWIVRAFADITTEKMHKIWRRTV